MYYIFLKFKENIQICMEIGGTPLIDISTLMHGLLMLANKPVLIGAL